MLEFSSEEDDELPPEFELKGTNKRARPSWGAPSSPDSGSDLEGFIVDDDEEEEPAPKKAKHEKEDSDSESEVVIHYPEEVNSFAQQHYSMRNAFSIYIQYLLSCQLENNFVDQIIKDPESFAYFEPARKKIEHSLTDRKDLIVTSSIWSQEFHHHLLRLPHFESNRSFINLDCQVCRRSNHPSIYSLSLSGIPYNSEKMWDTHAAVSLLPFTRGAQTN